MIKKIVILFILAMVVVLSFYIYSSAKQKFMPSKPEDKAGNAASAFMPEKVQGEPAAKGTNKFKVTGPVRLFDLEDSK